MVARPMGLTEVEYSTTSLCAFSGKRVKVQTLATNSYYPLTLKQQDHMYKIQSAK